MKVNVSIRSDLRQIGPRTDRLLRQVLGKLAADGLAHAQASMAEPKSGREYPRPDGVHIASAPGESPAVDEGNLTNSGYFDVNRSGDYQSEFGFTAEYAEGLELGTDRVAPRPFVTPAAEALEPGFGPALAAAVRKGAGE